MTYIFNSVLFRPWPEGRYRSRNSSETPPHSRSSSGWGRYKYIDSVCQVFIVCFCTRFVSYLQVRLVLFNMAHAQLISGWVGGGMFSSSTPRSLGQNILAILFFSKKRGCTLYILHMYIVQYWHSIPVTAEPMFSMEWLYRCTTV